MHAGKLLEYGTSPSLLDTRSTLKKNFFERTIASPCIRNIKKKIFLKMWSTIFFKPLGINQPEEVHGLNRKL